MDERTCAADVLWTPLHDSKSQPRHDRIDMLSLPSRTAVAQMRAEIRAQGQQLMKKFSQTNRAGERATAAVMAISMVRERSCVEAGTFWPEQHRGDGVDEKIFGEFLFEVVTHLSVLALGLVARPLLVWAAALRD